MPSHTDPLFDRAAGCLMGQIAGDSLGALVEFCSPATIRERSPDGPRLLEDRRDFRWERFCSTEDDLPTLIRKS